jgi:hypothetical protein
LNGNFAYFMVQGTPWNKKLDLSAGERNSATQAHSEYFGAQIHD